MMLRQLENNVKTTVFLIFKGYNDKNSLNENADTLELLDEAKNYC